MLFLPVALAAAQIVVWHSYREGEERALIAAVQQWNSAHPDEPVEPVAIPNEGFSQKLQAAIPRGHGPDAFIGAHELVGEWSRAGLVAPIEVAPEEQGAYLEATVAPLVLDGKRYGIPLSFKSLALFYRRDLVDEPPADTAALGEVCRKIATTRDPRAVAAKARFCLVYEAGSFYFHAAWLHGFGGSIFDSDERLASARPKLATPQGIAALAFVRDLAVRGVLPDETTGNLVTELFNDGAAAFAINGPWFTGEIKPGVAFGVAPLPIVSATGKPAAPLLTVEAAMLSPRANHPEAALRFLRWLAGPEGSILRAKIGHQPVACRAAWADPVVARDPVLAAFRLQLDNTVAMSNRAEMRAVWEPAQLALRRVLRGAAEPEAALREADRRIVIALRPPLAATSPTPYLLALGVLLLLGAALVVRRSNSFVQSSISVEARGWSWAHAYLAPAAVAMGVLVFIPFAVGAGMSLYQFDGVGWSFVGFANFHEVLASRDVPLSDPLSFYFTLAVTALWTVVNVTLHVGIGVSLALALRDPMLRLRGVYRLLLIVPWAVPNYITALIWKGMFHRQLGAINGLLVALGLEPVSWFARFWTAFSANVATNVWLGFPFMMVTTLGALSRIPKELEEAAALDGATRMDRLRYVILPLLRPALLPSVILGAVWTFNMFNVVFLVSNGEPDGATDILISQAYRWAFTRGHRYGYAAAYAVLIFLVLLGQNILGRKVARTSEEPS